MGYICHEKHLYAQEWLGEKDKNCKILLIKYKTIRISNGIISNGQLFGIYLLKENKTKNKKTEPKAVTRISESYSVSSILRKV